MSIAARVRLTTVIELWLLETACRRTKEWQQRYPSSETLAVCVDVSARLLEHSGLAGDIERLLTDIDFAPHQLRLRVAQDEAHRTGNTTETVQDLTRLGVLVEKRAP